MAVSIGITTVCPGVINTPIVRARRNIAPSINAEPIERLQACYQAKGCSAELVGEGMVKAVLRGQSVLMIGPFAKLVFNLRRISLGLLAARRGVVG